MGILNNLTVSFWALGVKVLQRSGRAQEATFPFLISSDYPAPDQRCVIQKSCVV